ncbi:MAG: hypothetical protein PWP27_1095 [Clostridiales bacterium]|jgi:hypothetical protein|nr:hypothetical protein [Clostridiales bacterium]
MASENKSNEIPLANLNSEELKQVKELEQKLGDKYYLMALDKKNLQK